MYDISPTATVPATKSFIKLMSIQEGGRYNFSNIRYAAAPIGELRFAAPSPPVEDRSTVQLGDVPRICPQAQPNWLNQNIFQGIQYVLGPNGTIPLSFAGATSPISEDCLFLDVVVSKQAFDNADKEKVPVRVSSAFSFATLVTYCVSSGHRLDLRRWFRQRHQVELKQRPSGRTARPRRRGCGLRLAQLPAGCLWIPGRPFL